MRDNYDFSKGERGKFYNPDASFRIPVYLDEEVRDFLEKKAREQGIDLSEAANQIIRKRMNSG
ncbi:MAG: hypothetical protein R6V10_03530 [bacterium]